MQGLLVVVSGFSGVGKGTLMKELIRRYPEEFSLSISAATRAPREGERDGVDYFFMPREKFEELIAEDRLLEYNEYNGNYYGTPKDYVLSQLESGHHVILEIDVNGGAQIKRIFPKAFLLYVIPPSASVLYDRLKGRGTETEDVVMKRMERAVEEADFITDYDYVTVNDDFENCLNDIYRAITERKENAFRASETQKRLKDELIELTKGE